jgi:hypothetical protein
MQIGAPYLTRAFCPRIRSAGPIEISRSMRACEAPFGEDCHDLGRIPTYSY